jgi:hypothetical protein
LSISFSVYLEINVIRYSYDFLLMLANVFLGVGMPHCCAGWFPGRERKDIDVGRFISKKPNSRILNLNPLASETG